MFTLFSLRFKSLSVEFSMFPPKRVFDDYILVSFTCRASVLSEVQLKGTNKLSPNQLVLVLGESWLNPLFLLLSRYKYFFFVLFLTGDRESGKTTLVAKLQGNVDPKKGSGLEYGYIDVRDEYRDGKIQIIAILQPFFRP